MSSDNAGKQSKTDVPPHEHIIKFNTTKETCYHGRSYFENEGAHRE